MNEQATESGDAALPAEAREVLAFWFGELASADWWSADPALDRRMFQRFGTLHARVVDGAGRDWRDAPRGRLAEVIVLDQFSRNLFRGTPAAFAQDATALRLAGEAINAGADAALPVRERAFLYMPYMHSESALMQTESVRLFSAPGLEDNLRSAQQHRAIIERFGRYPHRNAVLGRTSTPEELAFLQQPGSGFP